MAEIKDLFKQRGEISYYAKTYSYPCGVIDILAASRPIFREPGWENAHDTAKPPIPEGEGEAKPKKAQTEPDDIQRSMRRARARVRRLALANEFTWFVTLTLNKEKVDRYDPSAVVKKLNSWLNNQVKRHGLKYILVPERHKDGAIHFHGFFNDALEAVASGHFDRNGHEIYNLPGWTLGFTAAIRTYGDYAGAVAYVCKYIGKQQGDKPAGRWYYSGGGLAEPEVSFGGLTAAEIRYLWSERAFEFEIPGAALTVVNGLGQDAVSSVNWEQVGEDLEIPI